MDPVLCACFSAVQLFLNMVINLAILLKVILFWSRSDKTLQDIVYKLVPGLFKSNIIKSSSFFSFFLSSSNISSVCESDPMLFLQMK